MAQLPGVEAVSAASPLPFRGTLQTVFPGYLGVAGIALTAGRDFAVDDLVNERQVVIVHDRLARQLWPQGAVGQRLAVSRGRASFTLEVVGVTNSVRMTRVREDAMPHMFVPYHVFPLEMALVVKTRDSAAAIAPAIRRVVESLGTRRPVYDIRPMASYVERSIGDARFRMLVLIGFAGAALPLAGVGLYGTLTYLMSQRTQEFGVRMALGATAHQIVGSVVGEAGVLTVLGVGAGLAGASVVTRTTQGLLYDVAPFDAATLVGVAALVAVVAVAAAVHPAWRAAKVDPVTALRAE